MKSFPLVRWVFSLLFFFPLITQGQEAECISLSGTKVKSEIRITSTWKNKEANYQIQKIFTSSTKGTYSVSLRDLHDKKLLSVLPAKDHLTSRSPKLNFKKDKEVPLVLSVKGIPQAGIYTSVLIIKADSGKCKLEIPIVVSLLDPAKVEVSLPGGEFLNVVSPSFINLNKLLPGNKNQKQFYLRLKNDNEHAVKIDSIGLSFMGTNSMEKIGDSSFTFDKELVLEADSDIDIPVKLKKEIDFTPDSYKGEVKVFGENVIGNWAKPFSINVKISAFWAIMLLLLGVVAGRIIRDVQGSKDQIQVMEKFVQIRASVEPLDSGAKVQLLKKLSAIDKKIDKVKTEADRQKVEAELVPLEKQITQVTNLYNLVSYAKTELMGKGKSEEAKKVVEQYKLVRNKILSGDIDAAQLKTELNKIKAIVETTREEAVARSLEVGSDEGEKATQELDLISREIDELSTEIQKSAEEQIEESFGDQVMGFIYRILSFLTGFRTSAMLRYGLYRPLAGLILFLLILTGGFYELYVNGGDTLGQNGLSDYLKLFLWGVISDVFSSSLTENTSVKTLAGIK